MLARQLEKEAITSALPAFSLSGAARVLARAHAIKTAAVRMRGGSQPGPERERVQKRV